MNISPGFPGVIGHESAGALPCPMTRNLPTVTGLTLLALLAAASGCGRSPDAPSPVPDARTADSQGRSSIPVVAVGSQWYAHFPVWIGIERKIFAQHGFDVRWQVIGKSMDRMNAIASGDVQFASLGEIAMLSAMAHGNDRFYWVGNQDIAPGFEGLVARPGIARISDLKGKKIGFPFASSVDITCRSLLKLNGLDPDRDVELVNLEVGDVPVAFRAGNVDAALIWEPGFSQLCEVEGVRVLGMDTDTEIYKKFGTMTGPDVLILSQAWVDQDRERARRFMSAYFEALEWVRAHREEAAQAVQGVYLQQDLALITKNLEKFVWHGVQDQRRVMSEDGIFRQAEFVLDILQDEMKVIPKKPDFRKWVNLDVLPDLPLAPPK
ncbi:MAG: ABC transporter substrate-binding protein [Planctomycetes bacterium]|nr:ABC transporter substrate-binding protein [Planctomycetota bacterium]